VITLGFPEGIPAAKAHYQTQVDTAAGEARLRYLTNIPAQDATYTAKLADAVRFALDGFPVDSVHLYPWVEGEMETYDVDATVAANTILGMASSWVSVGVPIEKIRLKAKKAIREALSAREMHTIATVAINQLSEI
jgi:hypothetical protein